MAGNEPTTSLVRWTLRLEEASKLDGAVRALEPAVHGLFGSGVRGAVLRGDWLGHAVHPLLTDLVLGTWTSASVLDLFGGSDWAAPGTAPRRHGSRRRRPHGLDRLGRVVGSGPARQAGGAGPRGHQRRGDRRLRRVVDRPPARPARHRGQARPAGSGRLGSGAYLGGHLTEARKVASHHPAYANANANANANASMVV